MARLAGLDYSNAAPHHTHALIDVEAEMSCFCKTMVQWHAYKTYMMCWSMAFRLVMDLLTKITLLHASCSL